MAGRTRKEHPRCPICNELVKDGFDGLRHIYHKTCGRLYCVKTLRSRHHGFKVPQVIGVKPKIPRYLSLNSEYLARSSCHLCGKPKERGKNICTDCAKNDLQRRKTEMDAFVTRSFRKPQAVYDANRRKKLQASKDAKNAFDELTRNARKLLQRTP